MLLAFTRELEPEPGITTRRCTGSASRAWPPAATASTSRSNSSNVIQPVQGASPMTGSSAGSVTSHAAGYMPNRMLAAKNKADAAHPING